MGRHCQIKLICGPDNTNFISGECAVEDLTQTYASGRFYVHIHTQI